MKENLEISTPKYYIYHIFGKKIGVTRNLNNRVTSQQGYKEHEYEVLETSDDIDYVSDRELELQSIYGYKLDRQSYKNLTKKQSNKMVLNVTEQTTTFPCPVNKLKGNLLDNRGIKIETSFGKKPIPTRGGGSIPIIALFEKVLGLKTVLMGFGLDNDNIHSPNEKYDVANFYKGIATIPYFHKYFAEMSKA
jgi:hypothetical protein